jgi:hypothetical protein
MIVLVVVGSESMELPSRPARAGGVGDDTGDGHGSHYAASLIDNDLNGFAGEGVVASRG